MALKRISNPVLLFVLALILGSPVPVSGQLSRGGTPPSTEYSLSSGDVNTFQVQPPVMDQLLKEDEAYPSPYRFGVIVPVDISTENFGTWTSLREGGRIWRASVQAPGALALSAYFDRFFIPEGGRLFLYNEDKSKVIGAFTSINNTGSGYFATELVKGDKLFLEYSGPPQSREEPVIHLYGIGYAYRGVDFLYPEGTPDTVGTCEVNVKCMEGDNWRDQVRGIVRIQVVRGMSLFWCSGSVINDVPCDHLPYVLTADHCGQLSTAQNLLQWIFYYNYESPYCPNPPSPPIPNTMTGAVLKAQGGNSGSTGSDFFLILLTESIPDSFNVYYNGWSRKDTTSPNGVGIHHPEGMLKKISTYKSNLLTSDYNGAGIYCFWKVVWSQTVNGHGVTEPGSSGSPIFDYKGRIIGTLTGGSSGCDIASQNLPDYYGKFSYSWASNGSDSTARLKDWLDPNNSGLMTLDGTALSVPPDAKALPDIKIFPNPFTKAFTFRSDRYNQGNIRISLINIVGIPCYEESFSYQPGESLTIDPGTISDGIYILRISDENGYTSRKVIKQSR